MTVTATEARNRVGKLLDLAQHGAGSAAEQPAPPRYRPEAQAFYEKYKDWVDLQNEHFGKYGVFCEDDRLW